MNPSRVSPRAPLRAFTLIELLTVIAIIGILAAIIIPVVGKVRQSAYATKSVSNLRQLQFANLSHANENKGNFVKPYNGQSDFNGAWITNVELKRHAGAEKLAIDWNDPTKRIPISVSGFPTTQVNSIGYNHTDMNVLWRTKALSQTEIRNPSRHIAFAEASDWIISYGSRNAWNAANDSGSNALAYRAGTSTIVVTYGGNVMKLSRTEADDKDRWIIDPTRI